jgi:hypothetical protein
MNTFVIAREAKPTAGIQLDCFVATLLAMTATTEFFGGDDPTSR